MEHRADSCIEKIETFQRITKFLQPALMIIPEFLVSGAHVIVCRQKPVVTLERLFLQLFQLVLRKVIRPVLVQVIERGGSVPVHLRRARTLGGGVRPFEGQHLIDKSEIALLKIFEASARIGASVLRAVSHVSAESPAPHGVASAVGPVSALVGTAPADRADSYRRLARCTTV